jgi:negative regulator of sigma E activity
MSNEELESQLSAMFDDELPAPECELLARRLARDEQLRGRWGRYAAIGACIRGEPGIRLESTLAGKVSAAIKQEVAPGEEPATRSPRYGSWRPWLTSLGGLASAAGVAAVAILWMRSQGPTAPQIAAVPAAPARVVPASTVPAAAPQLVSGQSPERLRRAHEADSYVVPASASQGPALVPPTELANYMVAHSAYSGPLLRRNALSALVGGDSAAPAVTAQPIAATVVTQK